MKNIRIAAACCILGAAFCGGVPGETEGGGDGAVVEKAAVRTDSSAVTLPYMEAEPVMRMAARERPLAMAVPDASDRGREIMVDSLLGVMAVFTVFSFLGKRKTGRTEYREERVSRRSRRAAKKASAAAPVSRADREVPVQGPRERAELLKTRREQFAADIGRLMKRV